LSGAVPDADDTPAALLALAAWRSQAGCTAGDAARIDQAATAGLQWLLDLQNADGGWPTFCRGWGSLPFDRSGADLTAHALRSLAAWRYRQLVSSRRLDDALRSGLEYLQREQRPEGCWIPLWFGNQDHPAEENPVYGTARVLLAYRDLNLWETPAARRGLMWLARCQRAEGGWSGAAFSSKAPGLSRATVEETALAIEALAGAPATEEVEAALNLGVQWLVEAVETERFREPSPIGFYFAKLWYHEALYPIIFTVAALGRTLRRASAAQGPLPASSSLTC
jgi:squalene-hopene/tetraprenyl-beta-curcumene cyclase